MRTRAIALACLLASSAAHAAIPEGSLGVGATSYHGMWAGSFYGRFAASYGVLTPGIRALALGSPGTIAYAVAPELRFRVGGVVRLELATGVGVGQVFQPDPVLAQNTPLGVYTYGSAGVSYARDSHLSVGLEASINHWAGMGSLGSGGSYYRLPLSQPLWMASVTFSP